MLDKSMHPGTKKLILAVIIGCIAYFYNENRGFVSPIIKTCSGHVKGFIAWSRGNREFFKYLGIPYAKPPVGDLRFEPPQLPDKWEGIRYAGKFGSPCVQVDFLTSSFHGREDCLSLNVYVPKDIPAGKLLPVIVWFYGGMSAIYGGMSAIYGADFLMDEDIVLVTLNYRVGALGFLNTNDHLVRGNMGLKDQNFALQWVQRNIKAFGGNPRQVTIAGQSAGGASVHYHMLSPLSKGLFHRAISASGTALSPWTFNKYSHKQAVRFASPFCPVENTVEMVSCLKKVPIANFLDAHLEVSDLLRNVLSVFVPTVEAVNDTSAFLAQHPLDAAQQGAINKVPWLVGVTSHEGLMFTAMTLINETLVKSAVEDWSFLLPRTMYLETDEDTTVRIKEEYFGNATTMESENAHQLQNFTNMFSDRHFNKGNHDAALLHAKDGPVYLYYLTHAPKYSIINYIMAKGGPIHVYLDLAVHVIIRWVKEILFGIQISNNGTSHVDDLMLVFNLGIPFQILDEREIEMSKRMAKLYASFASNSQNLNFGGVDWPPLSPSVTDKQPLKYMQLDLNPKLIDEPFRERIRFWQSLNISN